MNRFHFVAILAGCAILRALARGQGFPPEQAAARMVVADGLRARLFASEPDIRQPILVKCDDRGRLWTIQYLQYPNPAGLKRVKVDRWSRTVYDRVPEPPPKGPKGADRITILEDSDGDGRADRFKDFLTGLNLATGLEFGYGGVFVLNVPYLLFYPDRNRDDVPDADPEVLLSGFGMEDAQSLANHLTWGPDGWLYGVNGSTTTCNIRGIEFQQGCWRYHPITHAFELFCEGGSNTYGLTFDENGELFYSTNGGPFVHAVQGGYFYKSFGKHGPLHNLYAYHYFGPLEVDQVPGGPPTGGTIYLGEMFPAEYRGKFIAGNFLGHTVSWWDVTPSGSTVKAMYGGVLLDAKDTWFGPTDVCMGPDGAMYVSDFCDERTAHPDPDANWDRSNGRIYRIDAPGAKPLTTFDISKRTSKDLVDLLAGPNRWMADRARVELAHRKDTSVGKRLRKMALEATDARRTLAGLWGLNAVGGFDSATSALLLRRPDPTLRAWTIRILGDDAEQHGVLARWLHSLPEESSPAVRLQLAATARRVNADLAMDIVDYLLRREPSTDDERLDWMIWWAIEHKALEDRVRVVSAFGSLDSKPESVRRQAARLVRRYAAEGTTDGYDCCGKLIASAPQEVRRLFFENLRQGLSERAQKLGGVEQGGLFEGQAAIGDLKGTPPPVSHQPVGGLLRDCVARLWESDKSDLLYVEIALRSGIPEAYEHAERELGVPQSSEDRKAAILHLFRELGREDVMRIAQNVFASARSDGVRAAALEVIAKFPSEEVTQELLNDYRSGSADLKRRIRAILLSRPASAGRLLALVEDGGIPASEIPVDELRVIALFSDRSLEELVRKHWGNIGPGTPEEKLATMRRLSNDLRAGTGDKLRGKELFGKHCGTCHALFGHGGTIGPDLTRANRGDRGALLGNVVDPSAVVRREFLQFVVETTSGQILTGLLVEQDAASVTVLDAKNVRTKVDRSDIEAIRESSQSIMPEKLLEALTPQELRDLFEYVEKGP